MLGERWRHWAEAWSVGCGLRAELGEVEIGAGAVTDIHGLAQALFRVVSVEDDCVENDGDALEHNLNDTADKSPVVQSANKLVINLFLEKLLSLVVDTRPSPDILIVAIGFRALKNSGRYTPHDNAKDEECHGE